jgi:hypothetical protein
MESLRVDVSYRPLRIGWAIQGGDLNAFRTAVRLSFALWGGRFNPIIIVDHEKLAQNLVDRFRVDMIVPVGNAAPVTSFSKRFPYLISPFFQDELFVRREVGSRCQVLDIHNALVHLQTSPEWTSITQRKGIRLHSWASDDPLADVFMLQFGQFPSVDEINIDYRRFLKEATAATETKIDANSKLSAELVEYPSISFLSRYGLRRHESVWGGWDRPGFFYGDSQNLDDLVFYWNLRAADIPLWFVDPKHTDRYGETIERWDKAMRSEVSGYRHEFDRQVGIWVRLKTPEDNTRESLTAALRPFGEKQFTVCRVDEDSFSGSSVIPPTMHFGGASTLGVVGMQFDKLRVSFALDGKPFSSDSWFRTQHLIASVSFLGGLYGDEERTLVPPFIPELNEFYARSQHFEYNKLRIEPGSIGLVIDAVDPSSFIDALPISDLFEKVFDLAGFGSTLSPGGLIARQLIAQFGGVDGARAFKIPGVRRLLKTHGPAEAFTKHSALQLIGCKDPENPSSTFKDYEGLYIEPRPHGTKLTPEAVFTHLVEKGLFRVGVELKCPHCRMDSWSALDVLKQRVVCDLCGREFDATRQLVAKGWHYRRSGLLGAEKNAQGAVPVVLSLQQLKFNMSGIWHDAIYSPSLSLTLKGVLDPPKCEVDFVWLMPQRYPERTIVVLGECKDRGSQRRKDSTDTGTIDEKDVDNLRRVAEALPENRFETFIVLAKLCPFTANEIALAKTLNDEYRRRVILLTARELEPNRFFERTKLEYKEIKEYASTPEELANATAEMYFK